MSKTKVNGSQDKHRIASHRKIQYITNKVSKKKKEKNNQNNAEAQAKHMDKNKKHQQIAKIIPAKWDQTRRTSRV